jgi:MoaA/NifB/PqqE/SkfB family radical SAM enzyme
MKTEITPFKLVRYSEILSGQVRPIHWDVDPSSACDHRCRTCPYIFDGPIDPMLGVIRPESSPERRTFLEYDRLVRFFDEAKARGGKALTFVGGGEPTLHPRITDILEGAHARGFKLGLVTHLGRQYRDDFFDIAMKAAWIRISVNAGKRETYLRHQGRDDFDQAIINASRLSGRGPRVGLSFLVTEDNYREIVLATELAKRVGCAYIQLKPLISPRLGEIYAGKEKEIRAHLDAAVEQADDSFQVLDQFADRLAELQKHARGELVGKCWVPRFNPKLGANGVVYSCCELAYSDAGRIGSIYEESLAKILDHIPCIEMAHCPHCWDKPLNKIINEGSLSSVAPPPESDDQEFV